MLIKFKIFDSKTTRPVSTKLGTKHPYVKGTQAFTNKGPFDSQKGDNDFFPFNQHDGIHIALRKCVCFSGEQCGSWATCFSFCMIPSMM